MIKRFLPTRESIAHNRFLRWLGPRLHDPLLWHVNRNSVARGVGIGAFFGFMVPVAQIPLAVIVALFARANVWAAAISTLVSNPFTYGPIYYYAFKLGKALLPARVDETVLSEDQHLASSVNWLLDGLHWVTGIGRPLLLGMLIMATVAAILGYFGVLLFWRVRVVLKRRRQRNERLLQRASRSKT